MSRSLSRRVSRLFAVRSFWHCGSASRAKRRREFWVPEGLEARVLLSGSPTYYTVNLLSDSGSSSGTDTTTGYPSGDLLWAIEQANANTNPAGSIIGFDPTVFATAQTIPLTSTLEVSETAGPEVIDGPGASLVTVSGGGAVTVFDVNGNVTAALSGLTISGGSATFGGGGIDIAPHGSLTLAGSTVSNNTALLGGGILDNGKLAITSNSVISDNSASEGGGVAGTSASATGMAVSATSSSVSNNKANYGGGIALSGGALTLTGSLVQGNSAVSSSGGASEAASTPARSMMN